MASIMVNNLYQMSKQFDYADGDRANVFYSCNPLFMFIRKRSF